MARLRFPMFLKFWVGCTTLAALLILGGLLVVRRETRMVSRGNYLEKHYRRYLAYQAGLGQSLSSVADVVAYNQDLRETLEAPPTGAQPVPPAGSLSAAAANASALFDEVSGKNGIKPDLFVVFDKSDLIWASPGAALTRESLRELEPVARVRSGTAFFNQLLVYGDHVVQLAGVPIRSISNKEIIGGLLIGVDASRYFQDYKEQSDDNEKMQHRLVMVSGGKVVAAAMPPDEWEELGHQLQPEAWGHVKEGSLDRPIIKLKSGDYDFYVEPVAGFNGIQAGSIGQLFLLRSRSNLEGRGPAVPWTEMIVGAVLSLLVASLLALWITSPIKRFHRQSRRMLEGGADLSARLEINSQDETADLADNINQVFGRLFTLASDVQGAAFQVGASSAEISAASKNMLEGLRDQTLKIESSTAAVTEMSASIQQVAANAVEATKVAEKSNLAVTAAVERMQQIRGAVEDAGEKMQELGESSKRIGNIVEVIRQISEQTSLLALNASIEAAHAGEQGRGFAVVADEVSSLARRVGQSAKDIEALIQTIKEQTAEALRSMQEGTREVENGTQLVTNTLHDLGQLISVVKDTATAVQEQAEVSDEIARNMDAVQKIAAEMVAGSEEAVLQGEQLHSLAFNLEQSVGGFNISPTPAAVTPSRPALATRRPR